MLMFCLCWNASFKIAVSTDVLWKGLTKLVWNEKKKKATLKNVEENMQNTLTIIILSFLSAASSFLFMHMWIAESHLINQLNIK